MQQVEQKQWHGGYGIFPQQSGNEWKSLFKAFSDNSKAMIDNRQQWYLGDCRHTINCVGG